MFDEPGRYTHLSLDKPRLWVVESKDGVGFNVWHTTDLNQRPSLPAPLLGHRVRAALTAMGLKDPDAVDWSFSSAADVVNWTSFTRLPAKDPTGFVYALSHPHMVGLLKIGWAASVRERIKQLSQQTNMPAYFQTAAAHYVYLPRVVEKRLHERFAARRVDKRREFFRLAREEFQAGISPLLALFEVPSGRDRRYLARGIKPPLANRVETGDAEEAAA